MFLCKKKTWALKRDIYIYSLVSLVSFCLIILLPPDYALKVHWPNRQINPLLQIFFILIAGGGITYVFKKSKKYLKILIGFYLLIFIFNYSLTYCRGVVYAGDKKVYSFMETLPKDAIIVAHPEKASFIPFFGKRSVLVSIEFNMIYAKNIWKIVSERTYDIFNFIYANDEENIVNFCNF